MESIEDLQDELALCKVMLTSMEGDTWPGVEEERQERRAEIIALKQKLEEAKRGPRENGHTPAGTNEAPHTASLDGDDSEPQGTRRAGRVPTTGRSPVSTPQRRAVAGPSHLNPGSMTLNHHNYGSASRASSSQSRKRDVDSARLEASNGVNKSRRTTPVHFDDDADLAAPWSSDRASNTSVDFIDLTNEDEYDADIVAAQSRAERQHELEQADRRLALRLSQSSPSPVAQNAPGPGQTDAFGRIMATQRLNHSPQESTQSPMGHAQGGVEQFSMGGTPNMPGAYDATWDQPTAAFPQAGNASNSSPFQPAFGSRFGRSGNHGQVPMLPSQAVPTLPSQYGMSAAEMNDIFAIDTVNPFSQQGGHPSSHQPHPNSMANRAVFGTGRMGFNPLSEIINRTAGYDFVNQVDSFGNPLPEGIRDYVNHVVHDPKMDQKEIDDLLANIRPDMAIPETNREGTPEGLKGTLYRHQEVALTWLKNMEEGTNKGGILADDMGLGKTISMLALILSRPAQSRPKTNLIIGPLSLLKQWEEEIASKVKGSHKLSVFVYHGSKKNNVTTDDLLKYDVVLTTYMTLAAQNKKLLTMYKDHEISGRQVDFSHKSVITRIPMLHPKAKFYRIILDEAQCIKNKDTQSSIAVTALKSTYRWCLSGTPMMNSVEELFSLIQFLNIKPYRNWDNFRKAFGALFGKKGDMSQTTAMSRLRTVLKAIMLRRKKDSLIDGKPILRLPPKIEQIAHVTLNQDESDYYNQLEKKSQVIFNKYLREGSVGKNYTSILVLLLRLRQACCHPHLNLDVEDGVANSGEDMLEMVKKLDPSIVARIKEMDNFECPICYDVVTAPCFFIPCGHDSCSACLAHLADSSASRNIQAGIDSTGGPRASCPVCRGIFDPTKCFTHEAFQKVHQPEKVKKEEGEQDDIDEGSVSGSSTDWYESDDDDDEVDNKGNLRGFIVADGFNSDSEDETKPSTKEEDVKESREAMESKKRKRRIKRKSKGKGKQKEIVEDVTADVKPSMLKALRHEASKNRAAYKKYMAYLRKTWLPSSKATKCLDLLKMIQETGEKTIVFSQWTLLLDLIEVGMKHEGFASPPVRYDGGMSATDRNDSATKFRSSPTANIILVSLKAGNAGLNLAAASRVIILDPFWNPYIEMQAVDRAYRIGQQREVQVYRILTEKTVEDRIIDLQERKKAMIEAAMDEAEGRKISRLTINELKYLFNGD